MKQCKVCKSTRIVNGKCSQCGASTGVINSRNMVKLLAALVAFTIVWCAIEHDWFMM